MSINQQYLPYDSSTVANYKTWAQGFGTALAALGWVKQSDPGAVTWANITTTADIPLAGRPPAAITGALIYDGAWAAGTSYVGAAVGVTNTNFNVVTNGGVTFACILVTQLTLSVTGATFVQNTTQTLTTTSVATSSSNTAVYSGFSGLTAQAFVGFVFTVTGFANGNNNGTYICTANTTTTITLSNANATAQTVAVSNNFVSSSANGTYFVNGNGGAPGSANDGYAGLSYVTTGFTVGANNTTFTVTHSHNSNSLGQNSGTMLSGVISGTTELQVTPSTFATAGTAPASDAFHWIPYNYEIWKSNGSLTSVSPIYLKLVYAAESPTILIPSLIINVGTVWSSGSPAVITGNNTIEFYWGNNTVLGQGNIYECDFSGDADNFAVIFARNGTSSSNLIPSCLFIDRTHDQFGNGLTTFFNVGALSNLTTAFWTVFRSGVGSVIKFTGGWPTINPSGTTSVTGLSSQGLTPTLPIFPLPGYVANPCLEAIVMFTGDFSDGELVNTVVYGTSHTFLMCKTGTFVLGATIGNGCPGIRWE